MLRTHINGNDRPNPQTVVTVSNPAVQTDWSYTVPTGSMWRLESVTFTLTADANVASRHMRIRVRRGGSTLYMSVGPSAITANGVGLLYAAKRLLAAQITSSSHTTALFNAPPLLPGDIIDSQVTNMQAGDQLSAIVLVFTQV